MVNDVLYFCCDVIGVVLIGAFVSGFLSKRSRAWQDRSHRAVFWFAVFATVVYFGRVVIDVMAGGQPWIPTIMFCLALSVARNRAIAIDRQRRQVDPRHPSQS